MILIWSPIYFLASNQDSKPDQISCPKVSYEIKYPTQNKVTKKNYDNPCNFVFLISCHHWCIAQCDFFSSILETAKMTLKLKLFC